MADLKKILYIPVEGTTSDVLWGLVELGAEPESFPIYIPVEKSEEALVEKICGSVKGNDIVVTQRFSVAVAEACHRAGICYLSWIWDSPQRELYLEQAFYETNRIFVFDRCQKKRLQAAGHKHVFYEPLAANVTRASMLSISDDDIKQYRSDISFVGNIRASEERKRFLKDLPQDVANTVESMIREATGKWGKGDTIFRQLENKTVACIANRLVKDSSKTDRIPDEYLVQCLLADEVSARDRVLALNALSEEHSVNLYTGDGAQCDELSPNIKVLPRVNYEEEMLKVFFSSAVNLNLTKASIETGVPLRVFDIMCVGGFVLTNEQDEVYDLFDVGKEIEVYSCPEELKEKAAYYICHEQQRSRIAIEGYRKVKNSYSYPKAIQRMLEKIREGI